MSSGEEGQEDVVRHTLQAEYHDFSSSLTDGFNVHWRNNINRVEEKTSKLGGLSIS